MREEIRHKTVNDLGILVLGRRDWVHRLINFRKFINRSLSFRVSIHFRLLGFNNLSLRLLSVRLRLLGDLFLVQ